MGSSFGKIFAITTFGESHGGAVGVVIDGCPAGIPISLDTVQAWLNRRRPGQSHLASPRSELDQVECLSGLAGGLSLGTPISLVVRNQDFKPEHYTDMEQVFRPSHADYTYQAKYGIRASSGGGRASARETIGRVAAAAIGEQVLQVLCPQIRVIAFVDSVKDLASNISDFSGLSRETIDAHPLRCPDLNIRDQMEALILATQQKGDSVGGTIRCFVEGLPPGLGEPVFDKLEADLAKAMMSLPASKGFEVGLGFGATQYFGSEHNDAFVMEGGNVRTKTNRSGGIQGGISNGEIVSMRVAFKPVATIFKAQESVNAKGENVILNPKAGRHDPCVLPRAVPMVEAMATLVVTDHFLRHDPVHTRGAGP
jgi:chorismate synthase